MLFYAIFLNFGGGRVIPISRFGHAIFVNFVF